MAESEGAQTALEHEVARMIVSALNLEGITAEDIEPEAPLFGGALGLDSIDALELALAISQQYGFELRSDDDNNPRIFASLRNLASLDTRLRLTQIVWREPALSAAGFFADATVRMDAVVRATRSL